VILECTQTGRKADTVGVVLLLTCDTKSSYVTWPILSLVSIGLRLGSFSQNSVCKFCYWSLFRSLISLVSYSR